MRIAIIEPIVEKILENYPNTRGNDDFLYTRVIEHYLGSKAEKISVKEYFITRKRLGVPPLVTVVRCRRRLQTVRPELLPDKNVIAERVNAEKDFRRYSTK